MKNEEVKIYILNFNIKENKRQTNFLYFRVVLEFTINDEKRHYQFNTLGRQLKYKKMNIYKKVESTITKELSLFRNKLSPEQLSALGDYRIDTLTFSKDNPRSIDILNYLISILDRKERKITFMSKLIVGFTEESGLVKILKRKIPKD